MEWPAHLPLVGGGGVSIKKKIEANRQCAGEEKREK